jgi:hypothetical protein
MLPKWKRQSSFNENVCNTTEQASVARYFVSQCQRTAERRKLQ